MTLPHLADTIRSHSLKLGVIGLGYVGLPVAATFAEAGFDVAGVDTSAEKVEKISRGISPIEGNEPGLEDLVEQMTASGRLRASTEYQSLADREAIIICVETPVDEQNIPRYEALRSALKSLGGVLQQGALVIVESTIAPRTMYDVVLPLLEKHTGRRLNEGFFLGNCPERVMPGRLLRNLRNVSRVVGGMTPETAGVMVELYRTIVSAELDPTDCLTAELVKTTENAYRDVQIAFANEVALICEAAGGDVWKVRELVNKSPGRQMHLPGGGVGGHCIPKDPWLLAYQAEERGAHVQIIPAARAINDSMPLHVADLTAGALAQAGISVQGARVLVMGYAYLEDSDDTRNSPSQALIRRLQDMGATVSVHDPYVAEFRQPLETAARGCHAAVVMVRHQEYLGLALETLKGWLAAPVLVDTRQVMNREALEAAGFVYRILGTGAGRGSMV